MLETSEFDLENRLVTPQNIKEDNEIDFSLRPKTLNEYRNNFV